MIGAWTYKNGRNKYSVVRDGSRLLFQEDVSEHVPYACRPYKMHGFLVAGEDGWRVANLKKGAQTVGMIRLKLVDEEMISNFKADGKDRWGSQISAQRLSTEIQVLLQVVAVPNEILWRVCDRLYIPHCCSDTVLVAHSRCLSVSHCCPSTPPRNGLSISAHSRSLPLCRKLCQKEHNSRWKLPSQTTTTQRQLNSSKSTILIALEFQWGQTMLTHCQRTRYKHPPELAPFDHDRAGEAKP